MSHFMVFKHPADPAKEAARQKELEKLQKARQKEEEKLAKEKEKKRQQVAGKSKKYGSGCFSTDGEDESAAEAASVNPSSESHLLVEVRSAWSTAHKVVFKDLPRLAKRMTIQNEEMGTLVESGRLLSVNILVHEEAPSSPPLSGREEALGPSSVGINSSSSLAVPDAVAAGGGRQGRANSIGSWEAWSGIENEDWIGKEAMRRRNKQLEQEEQKHREEIEANHRASPSPSPDPPASSSMNNLSSLFSHLGRELSADDLGVWTAVTNVVLTIVSQLEPRHIYKSTVRAFEELQNQNQIKQGSDHQGLLETIFTQTIGLQSRTFKVFSAIHQSILFPAIAHLHKYLYSDPRVGQLKDCRRADGWTVNVHLGAAIYVTHQRWEQNLLPVDHVEHFEVRWEMRLSFDKHMNNLRAVILRIQEIQFHPEATQAFKVQIRQVLSGSGYIV
ncbi:MAG: hypothetical protein ACXVO1_08115 [Tumebacillaceae bacterium]